MKKINKEYQDFINSSESTPTSNSLDTAILSDAKAYITPSSLYVMAKYFLLFTSSVFFSLIICPQFGFGVRDEYPLFHHFFHQNQTLCALYCATVFFITTHVLVYLGLHRFEKIVLQRKLFSFPIVIFSLSFAILMIVGEKSTQPSSSFILTWASIILFSYFTFNYFERKRLIPNKVASVS